MNAIKSHLAATAQAQQQKDFVDARDQGGQKIGAFSSRLWFEAVVKQMTRAVQVQQRSENERAYSGLIQSDAKAGRKSTVVVTK